LLLKDCENGGGRVAGLELDGEWMGNEISFRAFSILFQRIIDDNLKLG
jgi:hypothetical protein